MKSRAANTVLGAVLWALVITHSGQTGEPSDSEPRRDRTRAAAETPRRENEVLRRLEIPNEYEKRQESPLERQRRESYEAQTQPQPQRERTPLNLSGCAAGYVRRDAYPGDPVCVSPETRAQVLRDNVQAQGRRNPTGPKGSDSCIEGYVWREAYPGDRVCVTPETRAQTLRDNSEAVNRRAR